jgi:endogenous inhibitor of DNA gyrase (YacG/DUF329 family)
MPVIDFPGDDEPEVHTRISPECEHGECEKCSGWEDTSVGLIFCVHDCHKVSLGQLRPELR